MSIKERLKRLCIECIFLASILFVYSLAPLAQPLGLNNEVVQLWDDSLIMVVVLSVLGGVVGILARVQSDQWSVATTWRKFILALASELAGSIFIGVLVFFWALHNDWTAYITVPAILVSSWLGTKATRILMEWVSDNWDNLLTSLGRKK